MAGQYPSTAQDSLGQWDEVQPVHIASVGEGISLGGGGGSGGSTGGLTNTELRATPVPVSGPATDEELRATPLPVAHDGLTNAELRASPVNVIGPLTNEQLRLSPLAVTLEGDDNDLLAAISTRLGSGDEAAPGTDTATASIAARLKRIAQNITAMAARLPATLGVKTAEESLSVAPASNALFVAVGNVSAGDPDLGMPVKVGGRYNVANPVLANGQRGDLQLTTGGCLQVALSDVTGATVLTFSNSGSLSSAVSTPIVRNFGYAYDGTNWVRPFGNGSGQGVQGSVASGAADVGNPVKTGGVFNSTAPTLTTGQRGDTQLTSRGETIVQIAAAGTGFGGQATNVDAVSTISTTSQLRTVAFGYTFNGTGQWDRMRGDVSGLHVSGSVVYSESTAALAANAAVNGTSRASGGVAGGIGSRFNSFVAEAYCPATGGTLYIDKSPDGGTNWQQWGSIAGVAGSTVSLKAPVCGTHYRARFVNGANAQSVFLMSSYTAA